MTQLERLYESMILEHHKHPRNFGVLNPHSHASHGHNPLCGDDYFVFLEIDQAEKIQKASFHGNGCAISKSSGSLMTESIIGKSLEEALKTKDLFLKLLTSECEESEKMLLGKLKIFENVKNFPIRVKCAALVWRALEAALEKKQDLISTE